MATSTIDLTLTRLEKATGHLTDLNRDGQTDTTTPLTVTSDLETVATIALDPSDPTQRTIIVTGLTPGPVQCHARCGSNTLAINVTVQDVDLSAISAAFDAPVPR